MLDFARHTHRDTRRGADVCSPCGHTHAGWPRHVLEQLGREPRAGDWYFERSRLDLRQVDAAELDELLVQYEGLSVLGRFYATRVQALEALRERRRAPIDTNEGGKCNVRSATNDRKTVKRPWLCRLGLHAWNAWRTERFLGSRSGRPITVRDERCTRCPKTRTRISRVP